MPLTLISEGRVLNPKPYSVQGCSPSSSRGLGGKAPAKKISPKFFSRQNFFFQKKNLKRKGKIPFVQGENALPCPKEGYADPPPLTSGHLYIKDGECVE